MAIFFFGVATCAFAQGTDAPDDAASAAVAEEMSEEEAKQVALAERFMGVLEKNPRRGTALDRVYGHHVEFGTLDAFIERLKERVEKSPNDGVGWMLLGMFEAHRGNDREAIESLAKAESLRPTDGMPAYYAAQSHLLLGQSDEAIAALERAIARKPPRADLLEIYQLLGRVHQRAQHTEESLQVWQRLEEAFPTDARVQEQIAMTLIEEGAYEQALPRLEKLSQQVTDNYRRVTLQLEAAQLKMRLRRREEGLNDLEQILADLNPDSWLYRDVRRRIEEAFLSSSDQDALVKYYEGWIGRHPEDVDAMGRLAKFLTTSGRLPEGQQWLEKALKLAPSRHELRKAFVDQLLDEQQYRLAAEQYAALVKSAPGNVDYLRDWGKTVLRDKERPLEERQREAERIWNQMVAAKPKDAVTTAQVADLFRQANMTEQAVALYKKAVELAPDDPQYREYLGEYFHILKRPEEARTTWQQIAEGDRHTAIHVARLAEVLHTFGYVAESTEQIAEACRLDPKDFSLQLKAAEYFQRGQQYERSLEFADQAAKLAANTDEQESVLKQRIETLQLGDRLSGAIENLEDQLAKASEPASEPLLILARYYEADRQLEKALATLQRIDRADPRSIPALTARARVQESMGNYGDAAQTNRELAKIDRRARADYLTNVARLESQLGRTDAALAAGRELIVAAPGNTDNYEFFAQLCFTLNRPEEGLEALRKAVRINPSESHLTSALAAALTNQFRVDEAIEVYWRAFENSTDLDDKTSLVTRLAELYLQKNQLDQLLQRLDRDRKEDDKRREMTICLAQAHHTAGDYGTARQELESLLSENTRDTNLLQQLSKLCESGGDADAAVEYQRQLTQVSPGHETEFRLAQLLQVRGDRDAASEILVRLTQREEDPARRLKSLDSLLTQSAFENVIAICEPLLSQQRDDWELLYREGVAWMSLDNPQEAQLRFQRILDLHLPFDTLGTVANDRYQRELAKAKSANRQGQATNAPKVQKPLDLMQYANQVRQAAGLAESYRRSTNQATPVWTPEIYGVARMAAYAWLESIGKRAALASDVTPPVSASGGSRAPDSVTSVFDRVAAAGKTQDATREQIYDALYIEEMRGEKGEVFRIARELAKRGEREEKQFFLSQLPFREASSRATNRRTDLQKRSPLAAEDLQLMRRFYDELAQDEQADEGDALPFGSGNIAYDSQGNMYVQVGGSYVPVSTLGGSQSFLGTVVTELKLAGRDQEAEELFQKAAASAKRASTWSLLLGLLFQQERFDEMMPYYRSWLTAARSDTTRPSPSRAPAGQRPSLLRAQASLISQWIGRLGPEEEHAKILEILGPALDFAAEQAKQRHAERATSVRGRSSQQSVVYPTRYTLYYGKETSNSPTQSVALAPSTYVDTGELTLLAEVLYVFQRNQVVDDLEAFLRARVESAKDDHRTFEQLVLAQLLFWMEERDEAIQLATAASEPLDDAEFRLRMAGLQLANNDLDAALEIVQKLVPKNQQLVQQRELMLLQLAERLGDVTLARQAAEHLFGLRLDNAAQMELANSMRRLGLHDLSDAIVARVARRATNQLESLGTLMALYQSQGKTEQAVQLAHIALQRTPSPFLAANSRTIRSMSSRSDIRGQALQLLVQTGSIKELTTSLESQLKQSPQSPKLQERLIEIYEATGNNDRAMELLKTSITQRQDAVGLRLVLAQKLLRLGKASESCDEYLAILAQQPAALGNDFYQIANVFRQAKRSGDLARALRKVNLQAFGHPYYILNVIETMIGNRGSEPTPPEVQQIAMELLERLISDFPTYRQSIFGNLGSSDIWKMDRAYAIAKRTLIPDAVDANANPWYGVDEIRSYSGDGIASSILDEMLNGIQGTDKMADFRAAVESRLNEVPKWYGGQVMLAMIERRQGKADACENRIQALLTDERFAESIPYASCWITGQMIDDSKQLESLAIRVYEKALESSGPSVNEIQYTPVVRLIMLYERTGQNEKARDVLLKSMQIAQDEFDPQYTAYNRVANRMWGGKRLLKLNYPADALGLYQSLLADRTMLRLASQWNSGTDDVYLRQAEKGIREVLTSIDEKANLDEIISKLLAPQTSIRPGQPVLNLMVTIPATEEVQRDQTMSSGLCDFLNRLTETTADRVPQRVLQRLQQLQSDYPDDLSIRIAKTIMTPAENGARRDALQELVQLLERQTLEEVAVGRRPNSRQRREAMLSVPLWLVAREGLRDDELRGMAETIAHRAVAAARRQVERDATVAILYEWGKLAIDAGDPVQAERRWSELLDYATERPMRQSPAPNESGQRRLAARTWLVAAPPAASPATPTASPPPLAAEPAVSRSVGNPVTRDPKAAAGNESTAHTLAPLTQTQFNLALLIADKAADHGFQELSQRAVRESLVAGFPVPDPTADSTMNAQSGMVLRSGRTPTPVMEDGSAVASRILAVTNKWQQKDYPASAVCDLLIPIVFPAQRPNDIQLYIDVSEVRSGRTKSLGGALVQWAARADRLDAIEQQIRQRKPAEGDLVSALTMETLIAAERKDPDLIKKSLQALSDAATQLGTQAAREATAFAALVAADTKGAESIAYPMLVNYLEQSVTDNANSGDGEMSWNVDPLMEKVTRYYADQPGALKTLYAKFVTSRQAVFARQSGDYAVYLQSQLWNNLARTLAVSNQDELSLQYLGSVLDAGSSRYSQPTADLPLAIIAKLARRRSPDERYALWAEWTLPKEDRQTIRMLTHLRPPVDVPAEFRREGAVAYSKDTLVSSLLELVDAARECGRLEELVTHANRAVESKIPRAEELLALALIRAEKMDEARKLLESLIAKWPDPLRPKRVDSADEATVEDPFESSDRDNGVQAAMTSYLLYREAIAYPPLQSLFTAEVRSRLRTLLRDRQQIASLAHFDADWIQATQRQGGGQADHIAKTNLRHWMPLRINLDRRANVEPWWTVREGSVHHLAGPEDDLLSFRYPLLGDFKFSFDAYKGTWAESDAGYGGVIVEANNWSDSTNVISFSNHEQLQLAGAMKRDPTTLNHVDVEVSEGKVRFFLNQQLVYMEEAGVTAPWLVLYTGAGRITAARNLRLSGSPVIPREVPLFSGNRMDGWACYATRDSQPRHRLMAMPEEDENTTIGYYQQEEPDRFDWSTREGILYGEAVGEPSAKQPSWLSYIRPLENQEVVRYEFYYEPDRRVAHPTLGHIAFLLEPEGVVCHWITTGPWTKEFLELDVDNRLSEPSCRRGSGPLPLKSNDWNAVELKMSDDQIHIILNGQEIYCRPSDPHHDRQFGFFRWHHQQLQVRNATLSGDWPESIKELFGKSAVESDSLLASRDAVDSAGSVDGRVLAEIVTDKVAAELPLSEVRATRAMPDDQAYERLKAWVLPTADRPYLRVYWQPAPLDLPGPLVDSSLSAGDRFDAISCPAVELVERAHRLKRLAELEAAVQTISATELAADPLQVETLQRNLDAFRVLLALRKDDPSEARAALQSLYQRLDQPLPPGLPTADRAAEYVAVWSAGQHPEGTVRMAALDLARRLRETERAAATKATDNEWSQHVERLANQLELIPRSGTLSAAMATANRHHSPLDPSLRRQWQPVPYLKSPVRWKGQRPSSWQIVRGQARHVPGATWSQLFFQSPLVGKFEVVADRTTFGYREVSIAYGMHAAEPNHDLKHTRVWTLMKYGSQEGEPLTIPNWSWLARFQLAIHEDLVTTSVNGVKIHTASLAKRAGPWLLLQANEPTHLAQVRDLRIIGQPTIPDSLTLLDNPDMWRADYYGESFLSDPSSLDDSEVADWQIQLDELVGRAHKLIPDRIRESYLLYQRPLLEDGHLEWEAFWSSGKEEVFPMVGRVAWILRQGEVKLRESTDGQWDLGERRQEEVTLAAPDRAAAVSLKEGEWNRFRLQLAGDTLTLFVNDQPVGSRTLTEPANERFFGFFRFRDETNCRVRRVVYRGEWPKILPPVDEQLLAYPANGYVGTWAGHPTEGEESVGVAPWASGRVKLVQKGVAREVGPNERAWTLSLQDATTVDQWPRLEIGHPGQSGGQGDGQDDRDVTLAFKDLKVTPAKEGWGSLLSFKILFDTPENLWGEVGVQFNTQGQMSVKAAVAHTDLSGVDQQDGRWQPQLQPVTSGKLRLVHRDGQLDCLWQPEGSPQFELIESYPVGTAAVRGYQIQLQSSDEVAQMSVTIE